jgi:hypothetical protein
MNEDTERETSAHLFSVAEANRMIPILRPIAERIVADHDVLRGIEHDITLARDNALQGGGSRHGAVYLAKLKSLTDAVRRIERLGVQVKDYRLGLCDFPHYRDGRIVLLCWRLGEDEIRWWHDTDTGFGSRQPL